MKSLGSFYPTFYILFYIIRLIPVCFIAPLSVVCEEVYFLAAIGCLYMDLIVSGDGLASGAY